MSWEERAGHVSREGVYMSATSGGHALCWAGAIQVSAFGWLEPVQQEEKKTGKKKDRDDAADGLGHRGR